MSKNVLCPSNSKHNEVLIITGTPGVGKSSVSKKLSSVLNAKLVSIGDLVKDEGLYIREDHRRNTLVADMEKVSDKVKSIISCSTGTLIIEGHYAVDVVPLETIRLVFVLRRDPEELKETLKSRGYGEGKIRENVAAEILDVCLYEAVDRCGVDKVCEINVTGRTPEEVVEDILMILKEKNKCKLGIVDWLGKIDSEGKLEEYLRSF
ncbi:MAG: adenylate kinase family protein [Candidatus Bathyarchaeia archaeon]